MVNGQSKSEPGILIPPEIPQKKALICHRFYAPMAFPEPDRLDPRKATVIPRLGSFSCIGATCTLWNEEKQECRDVTDSKSREIMASYCYGKANDALVQGGGM